MLRAQATPAVGTSGVRTWTVTGPDGLPVHEIDQYLHWLRARDCSVSTVRSYAFHLAHLWTWLLNRGVAWDEVDFDDLADFMFALRRGLPPLSRRAGGERSVRTVRATAAAVREFYEYHRVEHGRGPKDLRLSRQQAHSNRTTYHFLAHVEQREAVETNRLTAGLRRDEPTVELIGFESDFRAMLGAAQMARDRLALSAYYDLGLRVGQALGLRHGDLDVMRRKVRVERRDDNVNGALSKKRGVYEVAAPARFFDLYRDYLLNELIPRSIENDYLFVNVDRAPVGAAVSYSNMYKQCTAIGRRAGLGDVNPHMLRHTHATALAKAGWTAAEIAARLGQAHASTADIYIHLADDDLDRRLEETAHLIWPDIRPEGAA